MTAARAAAAGKIVTMSDVPPTTPHPPTTASAARAVALGTRSAHSSGFGMLVALSVISTMLDHYLDDFDNSGWIYPLFVGVLVGYAVGGFVAGRATPDGALTNGTLAGLGAFVLWIPVRILIWVVRDEDKGLFSRPLRGPAPRTDLRAPRDRVGARHVRRLARGTGRRPCESGIRSRGPTLGVVTWRLVASRPGGRVPGRKAPVRGTSGLHRARCWVTPSRGDPQDSATESRPPMAPVRRCTGKGETVR